MKTYAIRDDIPKEIDENLKSYHPMVRAMLHSRGIVDNETAQKFLNPDYDAHTHDPFLLKNMDKVVERILKAISENEKIAIYSDYDADGIPGAVVCHDFLKKIGFTNFVNYIPLRNKEGYGLNHDAIAGLIADGVKLIITIDCGITDYAEAEFAQRSGADIIITDHHIPGEDVPKAFAVINPKQKGCTYPEKMICGSGVIFKVVQALVATKKLPLPEGHEKWLLDMVGLATLSDMVPLQGENRVFSYYGMKVLRKSPRVGLMKLFSSLKIAQHTVTEDDIAFMITPRINAASRMGIPRDAFTLLSTTNEVEAGMYTEHLNKNNDERKGVVASMVADIKKYIKNKGEEVRQVIVHGNPLWKPSLLGLVANSFSDEHNRPVFLWGREGNREGDTIIKGSCRAGGETDVVKLMAKAKDVFIEYGGHTGAGGFSVANENIHLLEERLNEAFSELSQEKKIISETLIDKKLSLDDVNWDTYGHIEKFAPFGLANPKPLFIFENIEVSEVKQFGKDKNHLELKFSAQGEPALGGKKVSAICFFFDPKKFPVSLEPGNPVNLVATLEKSTFRNFPELRLRIVDIF
ncbi:MAG: single-stranded-DNA-specific exonuclease RecJ [Candidatus Zambryskibacteria bacterium]|nr:single-stranded-DNA-specific exonuclease RecJ [Candidatus Zambryskibacteria bacterium]